MRTMSDFIDGVTKSQVAARPFIQAWLLFICVLIFLMVIVGGATRLTGSGLSITEWKPILGAIPPLNMGDWLEAFEKYKLIPQYTQINDGMSLSEFKSIFWWEWSHRFLGRFIGMAFLLPFLLFLFTGRIEKNLAPKLWVLFLLGGLQGFVGWYMVASGLVERTDVSQYRLAMHLGLAIFLYGAIFWVALGLRQDKQQVVGPPVSASVLWGSNVLVGLIFFQILAGAFVAGLKAGKVYNTWPLMDGAFIPGDLFIMQSFWLNLFENVRTVQFDHRMIAYLVVFAVGLHLFQILRQGAGALQTSGMILLVVTIGQVVLGIFTLLQFVPLNLALLHQGGALVLLSAALWHRYVFKGLTA